MNTLRIPAFALAAALILPSMAAAQGPSWNPAQSAVWNVVEQSWADETVRNGRWPAAYAADQMVAWGPEWPMPRDSASLERWTRFAEAERTTLQYEIAPVAIAINGDTAVVNYTSVLVSRREEEASDREARGVVETLVRVDGQWKYLSTTGFALER